MSLVTRRSAHLLLAVVCAFAVAEFATVRGSTTSRAPAADPTWVASPLETWCSSWGWSSAS